MNCAVRSCLAEADWGVRAVVFAVIGAAAILWHRARRNRKVAKSSVRKHDSEEADIDKVAQPPPPCNDA